MISTFISFLNGLEKALVLDMLKTAMVTEEDASEQPQEITVPPTRPQSRDSARNHENSRPENAESSKTEF